MNTFRLIVASPDGNFYDAPAQSLFLRAAEGDLAILAGHVPFITTVRPGQCRIYTEDGDERLASTDGGLLTVTAESVTLLSGSFAWEE